MMQYILEEGPPSGELLHCAELQEKLKWQVSSSGARLAWKSGRKQFHYWPLQDSPGHVPLQTALLEFHGNVFKPGSEVVNFVLCQ